MSCVWYIARLLAPALKTGADSDDSDDVQVVRARDIEGGKEVNAGAGEGGDFWEDEEGDVKRDFEDVLTSPAAARSGTKVSTSSSSDVVALFIFFFFTSSQP